MVKKCVLYSKFLRYIMACARCLVLSLLGDTVLMVHGRQALQHVAVTIRDYLRKICVKNTLHVRPHLPWPWPIDLKSVTPVTRIHGHVSTN